MPRKYTYIPNEEIESLSTWSGKEISGDKLLDGAYAKGKVKYGTGGEIQILQEDDKISVYYVMNDIEIEGTLNKYHSGRATEYDFEPYYFADKKSEKYYDEHWEDIEEEILDTFNTQFAHGGDIDDESNKQMLMNLAKQIQHHSEELNNVIKNSDNIEAWVVSKAERAATDLSDITHYLDGLKMGNGGKVHIPDGRLDSMTSARMKDSKYEHLRKDI